MQKNEAYGGFLEEDSFGNRRVDIMVSPDAQQVLELVIEEKGALHVKIATRWLAHMIRGDRSVAITGKLIRDQPKDGKRGYRFEYKSFKFIVWLDIVDLHSAIVNIANIIVDGGGY